MHIYPRKSVDRSVSVRNHLRTGGESHKSDFLTFSVDRYIVAPYAAETAVQSARAEKHNLFIAYFSLELLDIETKGLA